MTWQKEKPELTKECFLLIMQNFDVPEVQAFTISIQFHSYDSSPHWVILQDGDEWGDYEDIEADYYMVIDFPETLKKSETFESEPE